MVSSANTRFARPVIVRFRRGGSDQIVVDVNHASRILTRDWPDKDSPKRQAAMSACLRVLRGEASPPIARGAFVAAAIEARILAGD